jgi:hypothetical protein
MKSRELLNTAGTLNRREDEGWKVRFGEEELEALVGEW